MQASKNTHQNKTKQTPIRPLAEDKMARNCWVQSDALVWGGELRDRKHPAQTPEEDDGFCNCYKNKKLLGNFSESDRSSLKVYKALQGRGPSAARQSVRSQ